MVNSQNAENPVMDKHINCFASWLLQSAQFGTPDLLEHSATHQMRIIYIMEPNMSHGLADRHETQNSNDNSLAYRIIILLNKNLKPGALSHQKRVRYS
jgi:hypothetical protein